MYSIPLEFIIKYMTKKTVTPKMYALATLIFFVILILLLLSNLSDRDDKDPARPRARRKLRL